MAAAELLKELRKLAIEVVKEESEKSPIPKKVHASAARPRRSRLRAN